MWKYFSLFFYKYLPRKRDIRLNYFLVVQCFDCMDDGRKGGLNCSPTMYNEEHKRNGNRRNLGKQRLVFHSKGNME